MKPLSTFSKKASRSIRGVFTDIDDTLTTAGRLTAEAYVAMEQLQGLGMAVVPITGRPAGWCDQIARMWPVDGVVGENGAFYFHYDRESRRMIRRYIDSNEERTSKRQKLIALGCRIVQEVPGAEISADQLYRETDLAIDIREDVVPLSPTSVDRIVAILSDAGATAKISSIHVNGWFGTYDKLTTTKLFAADCLGVDIDVCEDNFIFTGDSPNDGPMFEFFTNSVGVANVRNFEDQLKIPPAYITEKKGGAGFSEVSELLVNTMRGL